jgi:hypothetical protein
MKLENASTKGVGGVTPLPGGDWISSLTCSGASRISEKRGLIFEGHKSKNRWNKPSEDTVGPGSQDNWSI